MTKKNKNFTFGIKSHLKFHPFHLKIQDIGLLWEITHCDDSYKVSKKQQNYLNFVESKIAPLLLTRSIVNFSTDTRKAF